MRTNSPGRPRASRSIHAPACMQPSQVLAPFFRFQAPPPRPALGLAYEFMVFVGTTAVIEYNIVLMNMCGLFVNH